MVFMLAKESTIWGWGGVWEVGEQGDPLFERLLSPRPPRTRRPITFDNPKSQIFTFKLSSSSTFAGEVGGAEEEMR